MAAAPARAGPWIVVLLAIVLTDAGVYAAERLELGPVVEHAGLVGWGVTAVRVAVLFAAASWLARRGRSAEAWAAATAELGYYVVVAPLSWAVWTTAPLQELVHPWLAGRSSERVLELFLDAQARTFGRAAIEVLAVGLLLAVRGGRGEAADA